MAEPQDRHESQVTLRDFLIVIFRRKWIILSMVAVTTTVACTALMMKPIVYTSEAKAMVVGVQRGNTVQPTFVPMNWEEILSSESELVRSRPILERAQALLDAQGLPGEPKLKVNPGRVRANPLPKSRILFISYVADEPDEAQRVCDAVTRAYAEYHKELFALPDLGEFFSGEMERASQKVTDLLNRRLEIKATNDVADVGGERGTLYNLLYTLRDDRVQLEVQMASLRSEILAAQQNLDEGKIDARLLGGARIDTSVLSTLLREVTAGEVERERLLTLYTERHPLVEQVTRQIEERRRSLREECGRVIDLKKAEFDALDSQRKIIVGKIEEIEERLRLLPIVERDITELERGIEASQRFYEQLVQMRMQAAASSQSMADYHVQILSAGDFGRPSNPRDPVRMSLGPLLSLLIGIGLAFFFDNLDHSLKNPEEVERYLELPVLTSVKRRPVRDLMASH
jgi:uncharacterized protein involved in exopolysaccharide biosynthesis